MAKDGPRDLRVTGAVLAILSAVGTGVIRTTSILIVLALAGTPTATSLCIAWCGTHTLPGSEPASCDRPSSGTHGTPGLTGNAHACDELLQSAPFVTEVLQRAGVDGGLDHAPASWQNAIAPGDRAIARPTGGHGASPPPGFARSTVLRI